MTRQQAFFFALGSFLSVSPAVRAQPATLLWGIESNCQAHTVYTEAARKGVRADLIPVVPVEGATPTSPEAAGAQWKAACPSSNGRLLGGHVERLGNFQRVRLWVHDPGTGKTLVADRFCDAHPECDLAAKIEQTAGSLVGDPATGQEPSPEPTYCRALAAAPAPRSPQRSGKVHLVLLNERRGLREPVLTALRAQIKLSARDLLLAEGKSAGAEDLRRALGNDPNGQALAVQADGEGALLTVYDGPTGQAAPLEIQCTGCDKEKLAEKIAQGALKLLDTCFEESCRQARSVGSTAAPPPEVCVPWQIPACGEGGGVAPGSSAAIISPGLAKATMGTIWGLFAVTSATAVGLLVADRLTTVDAGNQTVQGALAYGGWTATALAGAMFAVNIPLTIQIRRAARAAEVREAPARSASSLRCPNQTP